MAGVSLESLVYGGGVSLESLVYTCVHTPGTREPPNVGAAFENAGPCLDILSWKAVSFCAQRLQYSVRGQAEG